MYVLGWRNQRVLDEGLPGWYPHGYPMGGADVPVRAAERALAKARQAAVVDPEFVSLPRPSPRQARTLTNYHDQRLMALDDMSLVESGWRVVGGGLRTFLASSRLAELAGSDE